jgi:hypothetical protein
MHNTHLPKYHKTLLDCFFVSCTILLVTACASSGTQNEEANKIDSATTVAQDSGRTITTEYTGKRFFLPAAFSLDSLNQYDSIHNTTIKISFPNYSGDTQLNAWVKDALNKKLQQFTGRLNPIAPEDRNNQLLPNSFTVEPAYVFKNETMISYCFIIHSQRTDAAHPSAEYYSLNYHTGNKKLISFADFFQLPNEQDKLALMNLINKGMPSSEYSIETLDNIDFNMEQDSIAFNFAQGQIASTAAGIIKAKVATKSLAGLLKN